MKHKELIEYNSETIQAYHDEFIISAEFEEGMSQFSVHYREEDMQDLDDSNLVFSCFLSYKHCMPFFGPEQNSSNRYHVQLGGIEDLKNYFKFITEVCTFIKKRYKITEE